MTKGPRYEKFYDKEGKFGFGNVYATLEYYWISLRYLSDSPVFRYNVMIILLNLYSIFNPDLYAFLTIDILRQSPTTLKIL